MHIFFPQWQGSGSSDQIKVGAEIIKEFYHKRDFVEVSLSEKALVEEQNVFAYEALFDQLSVFKGLLEDTKPQGTFTVGGDCGLEIIPVSYLNKLYSGDLGVIWLDAHADLNTPEESPSKNFHGMPLRTLMGQGAAKFNQLLFSPISPSQLHYVGLREPDIPEEKFIQENHIFNSRNGVFQDLHEALSKKAFKNLYVHFDLDVLEPSQYAHTKYQVADGLSISNIRALISGLGKNYNIVGASVLESTATNSRDLEAIKDLLLEFDSMS